MASRSMSVAVVVAAVSLLQLLDLSAGESCGQHTHTHTNTHTQTHTHAHALIGERCTAGIDTTKCYYLHNYVIPLYAVSQYPTNLQ